MPSLAEHFASLCDRYQLNYLRNSSNRVLTSRQTDKAVRLSNFVIPNLCCEIAGGDPGCAEHISTAWEAFYLAAHLLDEIADNETLPEERGPVVTLAAAYMAAAEVILAETPPKDVPRRRLRQIQAEFHHSILAACNGQMGDLQVAEPTLSQCWEIAEAKTGQTFALACRAGAQAAGAAKAMVRSLGDFGIQFGTLVQIADDMNGLWSSTSADGQRQYGDLGSGKWSLPIAYTMEVAASNIRKKLRALLATASDDLQAEAAARDLICASGALLYLRIEAEQRRARARNSLLSVAPPGEARDQLLELLSIPVMCPNN